MSSAQLIVVWQHQNIFQNILLFYITTTTATAATAAATTTTTTVIFSLEKETKIVNCEQDFCTSQNIISSLESRIC